MADTLSKLRIKAATHSDGHSDETTYRMAERLISLYNLGGEVLDFGAGKGILTQRLIAGGRFKAITAVDILEPHCATRDVVKWVKADLNEKLGIGSEAFDVILAMEVIEHLENPRAVFREWHRLLRTNGTLIFSTPNNESWRAIFSLIVYGHFVAFRDSGYPAHITPILVSDILRMAEETQFEKPVFFYTNQGSIPSFTKFTWQMISNGILKGRRFSDGLIVMIKKRS